MNHRWRMCLVLAALAASGIPLSASAACPDLVLLGTTDYNGPANDHDQAWAVAVDGSGNVVVAGYEDVSPTKGKWRIRKYDASLTTLLATTDYDGGTVNGTDVAQAVAIDGSGNILVAGQMNSSGGHCMIRKYDPMLATLLAATEYADAADARGLILDGSGNVVVAGEGGSPASGTDWRITKFDPALTTVLATTDFSSPGYEIDMVWALAQDGSGNIIAAGTEGDQFAPFPPLFQKWRIRKYDASLTTLLASTDYVGPGPGSGYYPSSVVVGAGGNILVVGIEDGVWRMRIREYNASLTTLLATTAYAGPGTSELARSAALDSGGNLVVVGEEQGLSCGSNWRIGKYDASLMTMLATTTYEACHNPGDNAGPWAIAVDGRDNLLVAGYESDSTGYHNWRVNRYGHPACLDAAIAFSRTIVSPGQWVTVTLTVTNAGGALLNGIPSLGADVGAGLGTIVLGPNPSSTTILPTGTSITFEWTYSASGAGLVEFTGTLTGWDLALAATAYAAATGSIVIQKAPALSASVTVSPLSVMPGDAVVLVYTVSNSGQAGATVTPLLPRVSGSGTCYYALGPAAGLVPGGGRTSFTWIYTAGPVAASLSFTASGTGVDVNSGAVVPSPQAGAGVVTVTPAAAPCAASATLTSWFDGNSNGYDEGHAITVGPSGSIYVAGQEDGEAYFQQSNCIAVRYPPGGGDLTWSEAFASPGSVPDEAYGIALGADGSVFAVGRAGNTGWIEKWLPSGGLDWFLLPVAPPGGPDELRAAAVDPAGNLVVAGKQRRSDLGHGDDAWVAKYDPTGGLVWSINYNGLASSAETAYAVTVDPVGSIYVAGYETRSDLGQGRNILLLKYTSAGSLLWSRSYTSPGANTDEARAIALDASGNIYVAGFETRPDLGQGENGWVRKYNPAGTPLWTDTFNSPMTRTVGPNDRALGIAVDPINNDVFVTGREERPGQGANVLFARWDASGKLLDLATRNGPNNGDDEGHGIATGPGADQYVIGFEDWQNLAQRTNMISYRWPRPGCLQAFLSVSPDPVWSGDPLEVVLTVTNTGAGTMTGVTPVLVIREGAGLLTPLTSPSPLPSLGPGLTAFFTWTYDTAGLGPVAFAVTVTGVESVSGSTMAAWSSAATVVRAAANLGGTTAVPSAVCQAVTSILTVTITNTGLGVGWLGSATVLVTGAPVVLTAGPAPPLPLTVAGLSSVTLTWTWSAAGAGVATFSVTVTGADLSMGGGLTVGPLGADVTVAGRAALVAAASATKAVPVGGGIAVVFTVTNEGTETATGIMPALAAAPPGAPVTGWLGPDPPGPVSLGPGASTSFAWSFTATGWGTVTFSMTAAGADPCGAVAVSATAVCQLGNPMALTGSVVSVFPPSTCPGGQIGIVVSVTNTGDVPAQSVTPSALLGITGPGTAALVAAPAAVASLAGGASAHFTWDYSATGAGSIRFTATVTALDGQTGAPRTTGPLTSPAVSITAPAVLTATAFLPAAALAGSRITATVWVGNNGSEDAVGVTATAFAGAPGAWIAGPSGAFTISPGPPLAFIWTWSVAGSGPVAFSFTIAGTTCGGLAVRAVTGGTMSVQRPAVLLVDSFTLLAPGGHPVAGATVAATLVLRNGGDFGLTVDSLSRTVVGSAGLGPPGAPVPAPGFALAPGAAQAVTWTRTASTPCGPAAEAASASGTDVSSGGFVWSGPATSNVIMITGTPTGLTLSASATSENVGARITLTAVVTDACGQPVRGETVVFTVTAGGGSVAAADPTDTSGRTTTTWTLGLDEGVNTVVASVEDTALTASVSVTATNPLILTSPGAALDRNVLNLNNGEIVLARIWPITSDPVVTRVFTASGRLVRTLRNLTPFGRDQYLVQWDGLTDDEFPVARGVYLVDVSGGGIHEVLKVIVR